MSYGKVAKNKNSSFAIIFSSSLGSALEFYEFTVFGFLSAIIAKTYFPSDNPLASLIATFRTFAAGFLARPLGGIIFGYVGDRLGRRLALRLSIMLMGFSTTMIGLIPSYEIIGPMAPIIIILLRILQGISAGGEFSGGLILAVEHSDPKKKNLFGSIVTSSCIVGMLPGAIVSKLVTLEGLPAWTWRLSFLSGAFLSLISFYRPEKSHGESSIS